MNQRPLGPNMKKFCIQKMAVDAVPSGDGIESALQFLATPGKMGEGWKKAVEWCDAAILAVRNAGEPNPWREASEEEICAHLLAKIAERKTGKRA